MEILLIENVGHVRENLKRWHIPELMVPIMQLANRQAHQK
jgi:hypothetical protein